MPSSDQNLNLSRYQIIPRVLVFPMRADAVCLIKLQPRNGKVSGWTGKYNGPGGHVERGEDISAAARRELHEETGLTGEPRLVGTLMVETGQEAGIGLFIFRVDNAIGELAASPEGSPAWLPLDRLEDFLLVEDVARILERIRAMQPGDRPFAGRSFYDEHDRLQVVFSQ